MDSSNKMPLKEDDIIDLSKLFKSLFKEKWIIISSTLIFSIFSVFYALSLPNIYKAEALLAPIDSSENLSQISQSVGGLASIAGINLSSQVTTRSQEGIKILESYKFFEEILKSNDIKPNLLAVKEWNEIDNKITYDSNLFSESSNTWVRKVSTKNKNPIPSNQEAFEKFDSVFDIKNSEGFIYLSIEHESPFVARDWLNLVIKKINILVMEDEKQKALKSIDFLNQQISKTNLSETKQALSELIQKQIQIVMLADASDEYLFKVIDPPIAPEQRDKPQRKIICIFGALIGFMFGIFIALISLSFKKNA